MQSDPRITVACADVAAAELKGNIPAQRYASGHPMQCSVPETGVLAEPNGPMVCQLVYGWNFRVLAIRKGWAFGCSIRDGYVGYVNCAALGEVQTATHWVSVIGTHYYPEPAIKKRPALRLPFGSRIAVASRNDAFLKLTNGGFVPSGHAVELASTSRDHVKVAELFIGIPYLWGGNSQTGIDCSGLVQMALTATGRVCPRDSDMQLSELGVEIGFDRRQRGDLVFWPGHVGILANRDTLIHATAFFMQVVREPLDEAVARLAEREGLSLAGVRRV